MSTLWRATLLLAASSFCWGQSAVSDEQARTLAVSRVKAKGDVYGECLRTRRQEEFEERIFAFQKAKIADGRLNEDLFLFKVVDEGCYKVGQAKDGTPELLIVAIDHEGTYGYVAVHRKTGKTYWLWGSQEAREDFGALRSDVPVRIATKDDAEAFADLYVQLAWGGFKSVQVRSQADLKQSMEQQFARAWAPWKEEQVHRWRPRFQRWWGRFLLETTKKPIQFETITTITPSGFEVSGIGFEGYKLRFPPSEPPPKGTPQVYRWTLLIAQDGVVREQPRQVLYPAPKK